MNKDTVQGKGKQLEGKLQEKVGELTDSPKEELKGIGKQIKGKVQETLGKAKEAAKKD